jgi:peptide deformylase
MNKILVWPDSGLSIAANNVETVTDETRKILDTILEAIKEKNAIGLSGNHLGIYLKLVVVAVNEPIFMINPKIVKYSHEKIISQEGSVSFIGIEVQITRSRAIVVNYLNYLGNEVTKELSGLEAIVAQHEIDQMNGITILDRLSRLKKEYFMKKLVKVSSYNNNL